VKMFDPNKTRMIGLPYGEKNGDDMLSRFYLIPERHGQTDGQTETIAISISCVSVLLTRDKKTNYFQICRLNIPFAICLKISSKEP